MQINPLLIFKDNKGLDVVDDSSLKILPAYFLLDKKLFPPQLGDLHLN